MLPTLPFIAEKFDTFNRLYFNNTLPRPTFRLSNARTFLGKISYRRTYDFWHRRRRDENYTLAISQRYDLPEEEIEDVIIHEMIHLYISVNHIRDTSTHGPSFRRIMNEINRRFSRHITVSRRAGAQLRESYRGNERYILCISQLRSGRMGVTRCSAPAMARMWDIIPRNPNVLEAEWLISSDNWFSHFPRSRTGAIYLPDGAQLRQHLFDARRIIRRDGHFYIHKTAGTTILKE